MSRLPTLLVLALVPVLGGCVAAVAAGAVAIGLIQYEKNEAYAHFDESYPTAWEEVVDALEDLGYEVPEDAEPGPTEGTIEIDDVRVRVEKRTQDTVTVRVRAGTFDTEDNRRRISLIMEEVQSRLD